MGILAVMFAWLHNIAFLSGDGSNPQYQLMKTVICFEGDHLLKLMEGSLLLVINSVR